MNGQNKKQQIYRSKIQNRNGKVQMNFNQVQQLIKFSQQQPQNRINFKKDKKKLKPRKQQNKQQAACALKFFQTQLKSLTQTLRTLQCPICYQAYTHKPNSSRLPIIICQNERYNVIHSICKNCYDQQYQFIKQNNKDQNRRIAEYFTREITQRMSNYQDIIVEVQDMQGRNFVGVINQSNQGNQGNQSNQGNQGNQGNSDNQDNQNNQDINQNIQQQQVQPALQNNQPLDSTRLSISRQFLQPNQHTQPQLSYHHIGYHQTVQSILRILQGVVQQTSDQSDIISQIQNIEQSSSYEQYSQQSQQISARFNGKCPLCRKKVMFEDNKYKYHQKLIDWLRLSEQLNIQLPKQSIQQIPIKYKQFLHQYSRRGYLIRQQQRILRQNQQQYRQKIQRQNNQILYLNCRIQSLNQQMQRYGLMVSDLKKHCQFLEFVVGTIGKKQQVRQVYKCVFKGYKGGSADSGENERKENTILSGQRQFLSFYHFVDEINPLVEKINYYTNRQQELLQQNIILHVKNCQLCRCFYHNGNHLKFNDKNAIFGYNEDINAYYSLFKNMKSTKNCSVYLRLLNAKKQLIQKIDSQRIQNVKLLHSKMNKNANVIVKFIEIMSLMIGQKQKKQGDTIQNLYNFQAKKDNTFEFYQKKEETDQRQHESNYNTQIQNQQQQNQ